jgi:threonine/homoserine/homoserine lactone efflux protein
MTLATTVGVSIVFVAVTLLGGGGSLGDPSNNGSIGNVIQYLLVGVLVALAVRSYVRRETVEPPRWLGTLQMADARRAFSIGFLVILLMPSDVVIQLTVGVNLVHNDEGLLAALPFIGATVLVAALPLLLYLLFYRRVQSLAPKVRDWMNANSWLVNIIVYVVFIVLIL